MTFCALTQEIAMNAAARHFALPLTDSDRAALRRIAVQRGKSPSVSDDQLLRIWRGDDGVAPVLEFPHEQLERIRSEAVESATAAAVTAIQQHRTVHVVVEQAGREPVDCGVQHVRFPILLKACGARTPDGNRLNIWLRGPAGSGKTTAAKVAAQTLGLPFVFNGAISTPFELLGFIDANGKPVRTPFREAWEHGGVYLFDEVDSSNPNAVTAFNAALANGVCAFPDGLVQRHPDCIVIAGANTGGNGATSEYVGRLKQDAAFLNRFVEIHWCLDEALERALCPHPTWVARVQTIRRRVEKRGIKGHLITPRATLYGSALLDTGLDQDTVEQLVLRKGLADDVWDQIKHD
jgi:cobaltochelatase CobS